MIYPQYEDYSRIKLRILMNGGDGPPVASMSGPNTGYEGQSLTFDASGSYDTGQTPKLAYYDWDWDQDGVIDLTSEAPVVERTYNDDFSGEITLIVRDQWDQADTTTLPVNIMNQPPVIEIGSNRQCNEGQTLNFNSEISDPGSSDQLTVTWQINGGAQIQGQSMSHLFRDEGIYTVTATVRDDDGGEDQDVLTVQVMNVSPTADMQIPHAGSTQTDLLFQGQASDPGLDDVLTYSWDMNNDNIYEHAGQTIHVSFDVEGTYPIALRVSDGDGGFGNADEDILIIDAPPAISPLPGQTIPEGGAFRSITLDDFVTDPVYDNDQLNWYIADSYDLQLQLSNRVLTAAVPDSEWSGQNNVMLICTNPINLKDTGIVVLNVDPVNDRPHWATALPSYRFPEDDSLCIPLDSLRIRTTDIDNSVPQMTFSIEPHLTIHSAIDPAADCMTLWGDPDWSAETEVVFVVSDPAGRRDRTTTRVVVEALPDNPMPFSLLDPFYYDADVWPDTVHFLWEASEDPDLPGSLIYEWTLEHQGGHPTSPVRQTNTRDTTLALVPDAGLIDGTYFWWIRAVAPSGNARRSDNIGFLVIGAPSSVEKEEAFLPDEFALYQNYPNPFNPETRITYHLAGKVHVSLVVYNPRGQMVRRLIETTQAQGAYTVTWDSRDASGNLLPSGVYIYRLQAGSHSFCRKMLLIQ
jgi:PKD repeat protein